MQEDQELLIFPFAIVHIIHVLKPDMYKLDEAVMNDCKKTGIINFFPCHYSRDRGN